MEIIDFHTQTLGRFSFPFFVFFSFFLSLYLSLARAFDSNNQAQICNGVQLHGCLHPHTRTHTNRDTRAKPSQQQCFR